jgi:hypothetical protein
MGQARQKRAVQTLREAAQAIITDIEEVGRVLALERVYCEDCAEQLTLWPPELLNHHLHDKHPERFWPAMRQEWEEYRNDPDLARRQNYTSSYRVRWIFLMLQQRFDLYEKLVAAGVIVPQAQG